MAREQADNAPCFGTEFHTAEQAANVRAFYEGLTRRTLDIGDATLRQATYSDQLIISEIYQEVFDNETPPVENALSQLDDIITGQGQHSLLAKIMATIAYVDICQHYDIFSKKMKERLSEAIVTDPEPGASVILTGAIYARQIYHQSFGSSFELTMKKLDEVLCQEVTSERAERIKLGAHVAARVISELLENDDLKMQLPSVVITGERRSEGVSTSGEGYPDSVMHLREGYLPSLKKMKEAVEYGMPVTSKSTIFIKRIPRLLLGVEADINPEIEVTKGRVTAPPDKKLVHIYFRSIRRPKADIPPDAHSRPFTREKVLEHASFDSLSNWIAIRVSRELTKEFPPDNTESQDTIVRLTMQEIEKWIVRLSEPVSRSSNLSILDVAHNESLRYDDTNDWNIEDVKTHLRNTVRSMILRSQMGKLLIRQEDDIFDIYRERAWLELTDDDKVELAMAAFRNRKSIVKDLVPSEYRVNIAGAILGRDELLPEAREKLLIVINSIRENIIVCRFETIRDKLDPTYILEEI